MTRVVAVVQARTTSTRLPGKVLERLEGRSIVAWVVGAARRVPHVDHVVLAVPEGDDALVAEAKAIGVQCIAGPEHDVLRRFQMVAEATDASMILRLTADCPLLDSRLVGDVVQRALDQSLDYHEREGHPRGIADAEAMSARGLAMADAAATTDWDREHVGPWLARSADLEVLRDEVTGPLHRPELRVCVDQPEDLFVVQGVLAAISQRPVTAEAVIGALDADPELRAHNAEVRQVTQDD